MNSLAIFGARSSGACWIQCAPDDPDVFDKQLLLPLIPHASTNWQLSRCAVEHEIEQEPAIAKRRELPGKTARQFSDSKRVHPHVRTQIATRYSDK